jgi:hypothetical protein
MFVFAQSSLSCATDVREDGLAEVFSDEFEGGFARRGPEGYFAAIKDRL